MMPTRRQSAVLAFIRKFITKNGYSPSLQVIAKGVNLKAISTVHKHVGNLLQNGLLERDAYGRVVVPKDAGPCPLCGRS